MAGTSRLAAKLLSVGGKALVGGTASVLTNATERGVSNAFYGTNFAAGAAVAALVGVIGLKGPSSPNKLPGINKFEGSFKLRAFTGVRSVLAPKPTNPWAVPGITTQILKAAAATAGGLASYGYKKTGLDCLDKEVNAALKTFWEEFWGTSHPYWVGMKRH
ncbi:uncharacterized protein B0T15DRAFT_495365 [Chaetomium strumarium]|uniref:Uncharacterized protein n=1 Tax=Chaetomium strumarium TaxID=1170767 RepID=A0AAJ0M0Y6_9PEZI|nr:hypothetical protein B0T15DRAFT_495365 [Chaetomium strumarium]